MKKIISISTVGAVTFAFAAAMLVNGCSPAKKTAAAAAPVLVAKAFTTNVPVQIDPPPFGHVTPVSTVTVHSQLQGMISEIHFREGQSVKKGDPLFTIDPRPSQTALDQARADLQRDAAQMEYAKVNFARDQKLLVSKIISQDQLDTDKASLDAAIGTIAADKAAITNALLNLEFCHINSPVDGVTGGLQSYVGNVVKAPDDALLTINQIHPIYVEFAVPEQFLPEIRRQMGKKVLKVSVTYQNMDVPPPQGELTFIDNTVDPTTGTIDLKATFPNEKSVLWPGQYVQVALTLSELTNAVVVPTQAVQTGQNGEFIYVVKPDQTVEERPVTTSVTYDDGAQTVIAKGLKAGEMVVTDGQLRLAPGVKVSIKTNEEGRMQNAETNKSAQMAE
ncbi:MAG: efflux RND transporter periplasmic adaptor subunit [Limisphaerales bacterium]